MNFDVASIPVFDKQAKQLAKKYPSFKKDLSNLIENLSSEPQQGIPLGNKFYKIRMAISSKNKGKSAGARIITYVKVSKTTVFLTSVFDKSDKENITDKELQDIFKSIPEG